MEEYEVLKMEFVEFDSNIILTSNGDRQFDSEDPVMASRP